MKNVIGPNIKFLRNYSGLSQTKFGKQSNLTRGQVDSYERNVAEPSIETVEALANVYSLSTDLLRQTDLKMNPKLVYQDQGQIKNNNSEFVDLLKAKDKIIQQQKEIIELLKQIIAERTAKMK
jgi:transcriptional regulator with XRE-family HTH domain